MTLIRIWSLTIGFTFSTFFLFAQNYIGINVDTPSVDLDIRTLSVDDGSEVSVGNIDNSSFARLSSGSLAFPQSLLYWKTGHPLLLGTSEEDGSGFNEWIRIDEEGDVGIGILIPEAKLDIKGGDWNLGAGNPGDLRIGNSTYNFRIGVATGGGGAGTSRLFSQGGGILLGTNNTPHLTILNDGNIGIGTTNPQAKFDIQESGDGADLLRFKTDRPWVFRQTGSGAAAQLTLQSTVNGKNFEILSADSSNRAAVFSSLDSGNGGSEVYLVPDGGKVGIGKNLSETLLQEVHVQGTILAEDSTTALYGIATDPASQNNGVQGHSMSTSGRGVYGVAWANSGVNYGVYGLSFSSGGRGVLGTAAANTGATYGVYGHAQSTSGIGVYGLAEAASGNSYGVYGHAKSTAGYGVYGFAEASSGATRGVIGLSSSTSGQGVFGHATATTGSTYGVYGNAASSEGNGVRGVASSTSGNTLGVYGFVNSTTGTGVKGHANASTGENYGVYGTTNSSSGTAVYGHATATGAAINRGVHGEVNSAGSGVLGENKRSTGSAVGVTGRALSTSGIGVFASCSATTGTNYGVWATTPSTSGTGVIGIVNATSGSTKGVYGVSLSTSGHGVEGNAIATSGVNYGVYGESASNGGKGVKGLATATTGITHGVIGEAFSADGRGVLGQTSGENGKALYGYATGLTGKGLHAIVTSTHSSANAILAESGGGNSYAGYFIGKVHVAGALSKSSGSFKIDHPQDPENKYLVHSFVESPDMMNIYNGNIVTDANGKATVELPAYFDALNMDFRYQLTVIGDFAQAVIAEEIQSNHFSIKTDKPGVKVSWQVTGIRNDPWAQANRIQPEEAKEPENTGKYLNPEVYGKPRNAGIGWSGEFDKQKEGGK